MKYLIVSDIHGSSRGCECLKNALFRENPDCLLLLGDLLHGSYDGDEVGVAKLIRDFDKGVLTVSGNCDDPYSDGQTLGIELPNERVFNFRGYEVHMQHRPFYLSYSGKVILLNGHTHRKALYAEGEAVHCNPGSIALPRDESASYATMDESGIELHDAENGLIIDKILL